MKNLRLNYLIALLLLIIVAVSGCGKKEADVKKDEKKSDVTMTENTPFHIKYEVKGEDSGTFDLYFKDKTAKFDMNFEKAGQKVNTLMFVKNNVLHIIGEAEGKKMGMKMDVSKDEDFQKDFASFINAKEKLKDYEKTGSDEVLGFKCDVYKSKEGETISVYKDMVVLKIESPKGSFVAVKFEPDAKISDDVFEPPKDVDYMDMSEFGK